MLATCFATPSFLFAEPVLPAAEAGGRSSRKKKEIRIALLISYV
jgi:hypothetical protein